MLTNKKSRNFKFIEKGSLSQER